MKGKAKGRRSTPKSKPLTGKRMADNVFSGLDSDRRQQIGRTFARPVRQPNRRGGR
jgi:hypothetical protein